MSYQRFQEASGSEEVSDLKIQQFYSVQWMENCYNQLAVPNPLIEKLMANISGKLSVALKGQIENSGKRQALFSLLGKQSAKELFPHYRYDESLLAPPHMKPDTRVEILEETQVWLQQQLRNICHDLGYDKTMSEGLNEPDLGPFLQQIQTVYQDSLAARIQELQDDKNTDANNSDKEDAYEKKSFKNKDEKSTDETKSIKEDVVDLKKSDENKDGKKLDDGKDETKSVKEDLDVTKSVKEDLDVTKAVKEDLVMTKSVKEDLVVTKSVKEDIDVTKSDAENKDKKSNEGKDETKAVKEDTDVTKSDVANKDGKEDKGVTKNQEETKPDIKKKEETKPDIKKKEETKPDKKEKKKSSKKNKDEKRPDLDEEVDASVEALGEALLCVGLRDAFKMAQILKTLQQRCLPLPGRLRPYLWGEHLFGKEGIRENIVLSNVVVQFRTKFSRIVNRNVTDLQLEAPTQSSIHRQIDSNVKEIYDTASPLKSLKNDSHILEAIHVLNAIHIYNGSYNPLSIYWLCPLQLCFRRSGESLDNTMNIALHFYLFMNHCPLSQSELFKLAQQVMQSLKTFDPYLHEYLEDVANKKIKVSDKDFPIECLHQDKLEAKKIANELALFEGKDLPSNRMALFEDPTIFIRKWLATVFVSAVSPFVLMLTWDYIFLDKWEHRRLHDFCIVLLGLLKPWFYRVKDFRGLKQVFFEEPSKLYISDVRKAWLHWQARGAFDEIPDMNTNITLSSVVAPGEGVTLELPEGYSADAIGKPVNSKPLFKSTQNPSSEDSDTEDDLKLPAGTMLTSRRQSIFFPDDIPAWVPFNSDTLKSLPSSDGLADSFDLYIDSIRFMPDNASVVKLTGKIYNLDIIHTSEEKLVSPDIVLFSGLETSYRNPVLNYRIAVNEYGKLVNPDAVVLFQVLTVDRLNRLIVVLGSALMGIYDHRRKKPVLRFGGHQLRLRYGSPTMLKLSKVMQPDALDSNRIIPAATLLVRILPRSEEFLEAPDYDSGYYMSEPCRPTASEWNLYRHYLLSDDLFLTVRQISLKLLRDDRHTGGISDEELKEWITLKLENISKQTIKNFDFRYFVRYGISSGLRVQIKKVHSLPEHQDNNYVQVLARVLPGRNSKRKAPTAEGWGVDEKFTTRQISLRSYMLSPSWNDQSSGLHPHFDDNATLLLELFGLEVVYERDPTGNSYGTISSRKDGPLRINLDSPLAWTVVKLFDRGYVNSGLHTYPLFKGKLKDDLLEIMQTMSLEKVLRDAIRTETIQLHDGAAIEFALWDGNFVDGEAPPLQKLQEMFEVCGITVTQGQKYTLPTTAHKLSWLVSSIFSSKDSVSTSRATYAREKELFQELMLKRYIKLMNAALKREGLRPLPEK